MSHENSQTAELSLNVTQKSIEMYSTLTEIYRLLIELSHIYKKNYGKLLPSEVLQSQHAINLWLKISLYAKINPTEMYQIQTDSIQELTEVMRIFICGISTKEPVSKIEKNLGADQHLLDPIWQENHYLIFLKSLHHIIKKYSLQWIDAIDGIDNITKEQLLFYNNNLIHALSPANNLWTNPEIIQATIASNGTNIIMGVKNYLADLVENHGQINIRTTDLEAFKVGENLAATPGKVIFRNELIELIQYSATTSTVNAIPILIIPPWINKYYVLDLSPNNSLVKFLVDQGFTVYIISWINPGSELAEKQFEDYMKEGPLQALDVVCKTSCAQSVHTVGYCIGGTLLSCTLAYLQNKKDKRVKSATLLMSLVNFSDPGELGVFLDEPQLDALDNLMKSYGYLNGQLLEMTFNLLRPHDLIWPYVVNHYLLGKPARPFDILYWNADSSNLPYKMYSFYLRNMYLHNNLTKPGGITLSGEKIDISSIKLPLFMLSSEIDHITLWRSIYSGIQLFNGTVKFVLTESGHVRGVLNPPTTHNKYGYKTNSLYNDANKYPTNPDEWLATATKHTSSWWLEWVTWLNQHDKTQVPARKIPSEIVIEDAPGSYVLKRL